MPSINSLTECDQSMRHHLQSAYTESICIKICFSALTLHVSLK